VNPSANHNYAISYASENGHTEVVKVLLADPRVDPSAHDNYAIRVASANGHTDVVKVQTLPFGIAKPDPSALTNFAIRLASAKKAMWTL